MRYSIFAIILFSLACSKSEPATPPTDATPSEPPAAPSEAPPVTTDEGAGVEPSIELLAAGAEPRRVLRRTFEVGAKETMKIRSQVTMIAHMGAGNEQKTVIPPILHTLALEVQSVQPDGTATVGFEVTGSEALRENEATAEVRGQIEKAAASLPGLKGTYRVDAQGLISAVEMAEPAKDANRDPHMAESIGEFIYRSSVSVPSEAVGQGAKWTVKRRLKEGGILIDQVSTYRLSKIDGSNITVRVEAQKSAPKQKVGAASDQYDLALFKAKRNGQLDVDLDRLAPRLVTSKTESEIFMTKPGPSGSGIQTQLTVHTDERMTRP